MSLNNPAGRLHALLSEAGVLNYVEKDRVRTKWAKVLGVEKEDSPTLLLRLSEIMNLPAQVREAVEAVPDIDHEMYLKHLPNVESAFAKMSLDVIWGSVAKELDKATMYSLEVCDDLLSRHHPEPMLPGDERERIHKEVRDLFEDVRTNEEDEDLREFLLRHLKAMDDALQEYKISGAPPVEEVVQAAMGDGFLHYIRGQPLQENDRWDRFWKIAGRVVITLNLLAAPITLPEAVSSAMSAIEESAVTDVNAESGEQPDSEDES